MQRRQRVDNQGFYELRAKAYLLNDHDEKLDFIETVPQSEQFKVRQFLQKLGTDIFATTIEAHAPDAKYSISWHGLHIYVKFPTQLDTELSIEDLVFAFQDGAADGYLEGDADVFEGKNLAFDAFFCRKQTSKSMTPKTKVFKDYWPWAKPPPVIREWNMWKTKNGEDSISIRNNSNSIPFANEIVTKEKLVWFDWDEESPSIAIFANQGFTVGDLVEAIQTIIVLDYETKLEGILFDDQQIGSIDTLFFNPRTKHVSICVTFD